ncbi:MAG: CcmD family protein [Chloroflexi bacterium]|nr:MAG: CcmD family protein [Chloroflexota bacterium]
MVADAAPAADRRSPRPAVARIDAARAADFDDRDLPARSLVDRLAYRHRAARPAPAGAACGGRPPRGGVVDGQLGYLFAGFAVFWAGLFVYLLLLQARLRTLSREVERLEDRLEEAEATGTPPRTATGR